MYFTGYFARTRLYKDNGLAVAPIAGSMPRNIRLTDDALTQTFQKMFAPEKESFLKWKSGGLTNEEYLEKYKEQVLDPLDKKVVKDTLDYFSNKYPEGIVLLCYEKTGDFCHRYTLAEYLSAILGTVVEEYPIPKKQ